MSSPLKVGVAGVGYLGQHHARIYATLPQVQLVGVFDANPARAAEIAAAHKTQAFDNLADLAKQCDAMSVVVPTDKHAEVSIPLLEAGCHLLIEKPLCASLEEAQAILAAAQNHQCLVQVGHIEHFNPVIGYLEKVLNNPRYIISERLGPFSPRGAEVGVVLDKMIHDIGLVMALVRSPLVRVDSVGVSVLTPNEDIANARLAFANGAVANLSASRISPENIREIRVFQSDAYLSLDFAKQMGHTVMKKGFELKREEIPIDKAEPLLLELQSFVTAVRERSAPKVDAALGKSALEVALQITQQIRQAAAPAKN